MLKPGTVCTSVEVSGKLREDTPVDTTDPGDGTDPFGATPCLELAAELPSSPARKVNPAKIGRKRDRGDDRTHETPQPAPSRIPHTPHTPPTKLTPIQRPWEDTIVTIMEDFDTYTDSPDREGG
jgi:hypothetical protein